MGSTHCSCSVSTPINHDTIDRQLPQKDTFHTSATIRIRTASCVHTSYEKFWVKTWTGLPFSTAAGKHSRVCLTDEPPMISGILTDRYHCQSCLHRGVCWDYHLSRSEAAAQTQESPLKTVWGQGPVWLGYRKTEISRREH